MAATLEDPIAYELVFIFSFHATPPASVTYPMNAEVIVKQKNAVRRRKGS